ncbi:DUF6169 family protein [Chitinophaga barathri]|uniref:Uncharacterized protein n=1 Tax=Chitinophaga barathri TaxID=1647451 RepID=A0A3N4MDR5_9BACT|nr:DUF6169 family protein [Chitinophaga barathri]RPD38250.1 hypothetical protein EG028_25475 [Chitinophaga barathri]
MVDSIGFSREGNQLGIFEYDERIKHTILSVILDFFDKNKDEALVFLCSTEEGRARHRSILFSRWYHEISSDIKLYQPDKLFRRIGLYGGLLVHKDNTGKYEKINAFYRSINALFPDGVEEAGVSVSIEEIIAPYKERPL